MDFAFEDMQRHFREKIARPIEPDVFRDFYQTRQMFSEGRVDGVQLLANRTGFRKHQLRSMTFCSTDDTKAEDPPKKFQKLDVVGNKTASTVADCKNIRSARVEALLEATERLENEGRSVDDACALLRIAMRNALGQVLRSDGRETVEHALILFQTHDQRQVVSLAHRKCGDGAKRVCLPCGRSKHCSYSVVYLFDSRNETGTPPIVVCEACVPVYTVLHDLWWTKNYREFRPAMDIVLRGQQEGAFQESAFLFQKMTLQDCMAAAPKYDRAAMSKKLRCLQDAGLLSAMDAYVGGAD